MDVNIVKIDGKPLEKLIETVGAGTGIIYKPRAIRKEADARAYEILKIAEAEAKASIIKSDAEHEIAERARQRLYYQEMQRQRNIENVVDYAAQNLHQDVSEQPVDKDWRTRFFNKAQDITSEELQIVWGRILASEINQPGRISLRTLDILSNITKDEALIFEKFCALATDDGFIIEPQDSFVEIESVVAANVSFSETLLLREIGLLTTQKIMVRLTPERTTPNEVSLSFGELILKITKEDLSVLGFDALSLTKSGEELLNILPKRSINTDYIDTIVSDLLKRKYDVIKELKNN